MKVQTCSDRQWLDAAKSGRSVRIPAAVTLALAVVERAAQSGMAVERVRCYPHGLPVMCLSGATYRIRWFSVSLMNIPPLASTQIPCGRASCVFNGSQSRASPGWPVPATSSMVPRATSSRRIAWFSVSARYTFPSRATAIFFGPDKVASLAGPLRLRRQILIARVARLTGASECGQYLGPGVESANHVIAGVRDEEIALAIESDLVRMS